MERLLDSAISTKLTSPVKQPRRLTVCIPARKVSADVGHETVKEMIVQGLKKHIEDFQFNVHVDTYAPTITSGDTRPGIFGAIAKASACVASIISGGLYLEAPHLLTVRIPLCQVAKGISHETVKEMVVKNLSEVIADFQFDVQVGLYTPAVSCSDTRPEIFELLAKASACVASTLSNTTTREVTRA